MKHAELIARLEDAEVGDLDLSADVIEATGTPVPRDVPITWLEDHECAPVTTSIDAALALAKRVLPREAMWNISHMAVIGGKDFYFCDLHLPETGPEINTSGDGWSPSLAVCAAILRALDAQEKEK